MRRIRIGPIEATGRILDDDEPVLPVVTVAPIGDTVEEDGGAGFNLTRASEDLSEALEVFFTVEDPDGVLTSAAPTGATIEAGSTTAEVLMDAEVDGADAALTLTPGRRRGAIGWGTPHTATQTVQDEDTKPVVTTALTSRVTEGRHAHVRGGDGRSIPQGDPGELPPRRHRGAGRGLPAAPSPAP